MRVTPLDIRKQEFKKVMRGLDSEEVYAFLNTVAEEYEAVLSDNKNLRERIVAIEERLNEFKAIETNLRNTLLTAEKLTQEAKENARREAALLIREAEMEAEKAAELIRAHVSQLRREVLELKKNKDNYITRLKTLLDSHRKMLGGFEEDFAGVDREIEKIGSQVEEDAKKGAAPPRMNRERITEDFGHEAKDKVTWGDEPKREDEPRPQMPRPGFETRETPGQKAKSPEDRNIFAPPGMREDDGPAAPTMGPAAGPGRPQQAGQKQATQLNIEPIGATVSEVGGGAQARPAPGQFGQPEPRPQDDWKQYEVRKQPTDWKNYEIFGKGPQQPQQAQQAQRPQAAPRMADHEVESALSSLKEAASATEEMIQRELSQMPGQRPASPQPGPQQAQPSQQQSPAPQPRPQQAAPTGNAAPGPEATWSMEDLRRNLTNLSKDEGNQQ